jgi:hypothetical protein
MDVAMRLQINMLRAVDNGATSSEIDEVLTEAGSYVAFPNSQDERVLATTNN